MCELNTSTQVCNALANKFAFQSRSCIARLKRQLQNLHPGSKSCTEYLQSAKLWANQPAAIGKPFDNDDLNMIQCYGVKMPVP